MAQTTFGSVEEQDFECIEKFRAIEWISVADALPKILAQSLKHRRLGAPAASGCMRCRPEGYPPTARETESRDERSTYS